MHMAAEDRRSLF